MYRGAENGDGIPTEGAGGEARGAGAEEDAAPSNIMHAAYVGALELVKAMVANGTAADTPDILQGSTALHWASFGGHLNVVRWLVKQGGADADRPNQDGCTPLLFACERGHTGVAQWLVREGGAKVNSKDNVLWQTPLHRVCLHSRRDSSGSTGSDLEDLILWLVQAGADLAAVDRFGNHVEDVRSPTEEDTLVLTASRSKLCDMIALARQEGETESGARERLKRRGSVRQKNSGDVIVQLSPKLEAKQRAPLSRRGSRKGNIGGSVLSRSGNFSGGAPPSESQRFNRTTGSYNTSSTLQGNRESHQLRPIGGRGTSKSFPLNDSDEAEISEASPGRQQRASGGSGGGVAAPTAGGGTRVGGGPPVPAVTGGELVGDEKGADDEGSGGYMDEMVAIFGGGKMQAPRSEAVPDIQQQQQSSRNSGERENDKEREKTEREAAASTDEERRQSQSIRTAEEALRTEGDKATALEEAVAADEKRRMDGAGQQVVDQIRELTLEKAAGNISEKQFSTKKGQLLEMEQLRRGADEEARRRAQGDAEDAGAGILTSVGQNTPLPSPKAGSGKGDSETDDDYDNDETMPNVLAEDDKEGRITYKASDIDRYTMAKIDQPKVFGEVPESVKESLAAREAATMATTTEDGVGTDEGLKHSKRGKRGGEGEGGKDPASPSSVFLDKNGAAVRQKGGVSSSGSGDNGSRNAVDRKHKSSGGGCTCAVM